MRVLTDREKSVLDLLAQGLTDKQIGAELGISFATIKVHMKSLRMKLDVDNRVQAAIKVNRLKVNRMENCLLHIRTLNPHDEKMVREIDAALHYRPLPTDVLDSSGQQESHQRNAGNSAVDLDRRRTRL